MRATLSEPRPRPGSFAPGSLRRIPYGWVFEAVNRFDFTTLQSLSGDVK